MYTASEIKKQFAEQIMYVPKEYRNEIRQRYKDGEYDACGLDGLIAIRIALEFYPSYSEKVLEINFHGTKAWDVKAKIKTIIPGFTQTPVTDAFCDAIAGYLAISKAVMKLIAVLKEYPLQDIPEFRRGATLDLIPWVEDRIRWWLEGGDRPGLILDNRAIDVQAKIVVTDLPIPDDQSGTSAFPININTTKENPNHD
jgi:hypothetical protein